MLSVQRLFHSCRHNCRRNRPHGYLQGLSGVLFLSLVLLLAGPAMGQEPGVQPDPRTSYDCELMFGTLIPAKNGLDSTIPGWGARFSDPTSKGVFEGSFFAGNGNAISYQSLAFDYRMDFQFESLFAHFLIGLHIDQYSQGPPDSESDLAGGWQFGGGGMVPIAGPLLLRFDFRDRFSPGQILEVTVGLTYRIPSGQGAGQNGN